MSTSLKRVGRLTPALVAVALVGVPVAQAGAKPVTTPSARWRGTSGTRMRSTA